MSLVFPTLHFLFFSLYNCYCSLNNISDYPNNGHYLVKYFGIPVSPLDASEVLSSSEQGTDNQSIKTVETLTRYLTSYLY